MWFTFKPTDAMDGIARRCWSRKSHGKRPNRGDGVDSHASIGQSITSLSITILQHNLDVILGPIRIR
jgi:hypothetical protein